MWYVIFTFVAEGALGRCCRRRSPESSLHAEVLRRDVRMTGGHFPERAGDEEEAQEGRQARRQAGHQAGACGQLLRFLQPPGGAAPGHAAQRGPGRGAPAAHGGGLRDRVPPPPPPPCPPSTCLPRYRLCRPQQNDFITELSEGQAESHGSTRRTARSHRGTQAWPM